MPLVQGNEIYADNVELDFGGAMGHMDFKTRSDADDGEILSDVGDSLLDVAARNDGVPYGKLVQVDVTFDVDDAKTQTA